MLISVTLIWGSSVTIFYECSVGSLGFGHLVIWRAWLWSFWGGGRCLAHSYSHFPNPPEVSTHRYPIRGLEDKQHSTEAFGGGGGEALKKFSQVLRLKL